MWGPGEVVEKKYVAKVVLCVLESNIPSCAQFHLSTPYLRPSLDMANNSKYVLIAISDNKHSSAKVLSNFTELLTWELRQY